MPLALRDWKTWFGLFAWNPVYTWTVLKTYYRRATGHLDNAWFEFVMPETNAAVRGQHRHWARFTLLGHAVLAAIFIATSHWFLIVLFNCGAHYCGLLNFLCGQPQHFGISPNVPDPRLSCRTYTCSWLPGFLYWKMNYHIEHHMFPAVPFFNLPKLHRIITRDLPPATHGLQATWKQMLEIHRQQAADANYVYVPPLPQSTGDRATDAVLEREAALAG